MLAMKRRVRCLSVGSAFLVSAVVVGLLAAETADPQSAPRGHTRDNSDWWSYTGRFEADDETISQHREVPASNFQILGVKLNDETFSNAMIKVGKATVIERGDAAKGRSQVCYMSSANEEKIYLVFERGEVNDAFYVFRGGPDWNGSNLCLDSSLITEKLSTASGLRLGQTSAQVKSILGKPSLQSKERLVYSLGVQKRTSAENTQNMKRRNPQLTDEELHRNYDFYSLGVYIEARFATDKLVYLGISKTESY